MQNEVARLDGFLYGLAVASGRIRDYTASSYLLDVAEGDFYVEQSIKAKFEWYPDLSIPHVQKLERGLYALEHEIRPFLIRGTSVLAAESASDLRKFLSDRVMDMIEPILGDREVHEVVRADAAAKPFCSEVVFFCIRFDKKMLVIQFNDDKEFKRRFEKSKPEEL